MSIRRSVRKGFTLVEILIVVVILGILAAIVVPQFTNAANDARGGNLLTQVQTLENQIELYRARTGGYPDLATDGWDVLIDEGYLKAAPINPLSRTADNPGTDPVTDWGYDYTQVHAFWPDLGTADTEVDWDPTRGLVDEGTGPERE